MQNNDLNIDNILVNTNNITDKKHKIYHRIANDIEYGRIYKLPEYLSVLDILRIKGPYKPLLASYYGYIGLLKMLVENGYDLKITNRDNENCLLIASYKGHFGIIDYLLENDFDINYENILGDNCYLMASNESIQFLEYLEEKGANIYHINNYNENAIVYCIMKNNIENIKYLIEQKKFIVKYNHDIDLIVRACYYNSLDIVKYFIQFIRNPNITDCYYWTLIHNNNDIYQILIKEYGNQITQKKHEMTLFQTSTNLFININRYISKEFKEKYNGILKWSILNYLEDKNDINNITSTNVNTLMILITTGNLQLIDYYHNKYSFNLEQRSLSHNDLYTLSICNKSYNVIKYLSLIGLEMDYVNINYLNYKKERYYYDIYMLYHNYLNNIKLVIDDEDNNIVSFKQLSNINSFSEEISYDNIDTECIICKDRFIHMDEVIKCKKNHLYHTSCLLLTLNNSILKFSDCLVCFQKNLLKSSNLYIWFTKPNMEYLNNQKKEEFIYMQFICDYNSKEDTNLIYPVTIHPEQYPYMLSDLSVKKGQDVKSINKNSYNISYTTTTHVKNALENNKYNKYENKILCDNIDISWTDAYKSLIEKEEKLQGEALINLINQIDNNVALSQNNNNLDILENTINNDVELTNTNIVNTLINNIDMDELDNEDGFNELDNEDDFNELDNEDGFSELNSESEYTYINSMLNDAYYKHMMLRIIVNRLN
jgi:ankyrin repeat protein